MTIKPTKKERKKDQKAKVIIWELLSLCIIPAIAAFFYTVTHTILGSEEPPVMLIVMLVLFTWQPPVFVSVAYKQKVDKQWQALEDLEKKVTLRSAKESVVCQGEFDWRKKKTPNGWMILTQDKLKYSIFTGNNLTDESILLSDIQSVDTKGERLYNTLIVKTNSRTYRFYVCKAKLWKEKIEKTKQ